MRDATDATDARVAVPPAGRDPAAMTALAAALGAPHARYIGGWVRDTLLGQAPDDIDMATAHAPDAVIARLDAAGIAYWTSKSGLAHGTVTAMPDGRPVEVTTLRRDVATDGRHATVAFTDDWRADAARRDFTINALSADPLTGQVHDPFGGLADLAAGRVVFIGDPRQRIAEDHLRILRFFRFHARFGRRAADAAALAACAARANDLMALSRERIAGELLKLLALPDPAPAVALMVDGAILRGVLPEIADAAPLAALVAAEAAAGIAGDPLRRLAALLPRDPAVAAAVARRLRLSRAQEGRLAAAAGPVPAGDPYAAAWTIGAPAMIDRLLLDGADPAIVQGLAGWQRPHFGLSGGALIERGLAPGPAVAATLQAIEARWVAEGFPGDDRLAAIADAAVDQAVSRLM